MSDHGFTTFGRAVNLNTWLSRRGFLTLEEPASNATDLGGTDWSSTEAHALGRNGLYLNLKGREQHGVVAGGQQKAALTANLTEQLMAWRNPPNGRQAIEAVYPTHAHDANKAVAVLFTTGKQLRGASIQDLSGAILGFYGLAQSADRQEHSR